jgi:hypothetical protein
MMPTEEYKPLLDRQAFALGHKPLTDLATPVLCEAINYSLWAWWRCLTTGSHDDQIHNLAPFVLFRHVIEMTDGVQVLLDCSCSVPAVPVLRSSFEGCLNLEYILKMDTERRSLSWLCSYAHQRLEYYERLDPSTEFGRAFQATQAKEKAGGAPSHPDIPLAIAILRSLLTKPYMVPVEAEYQAKKGKRKVGPYWYSLFGGPRNLRYLAAQLDHRTEYDLLYGDWSRIAHGNDMDSYIATSSSGRPAFRSLRYPQQNFQIIATLALDFLIRALVLVTDHYRPDEPSRQRWYDEEIRERRERLLHSEVEFPNIEYGREGITRCDG